MSGENTSADDGNNNNQNQNSAANNNQNDNNSNNMDNNSSFWDNDKQNQGNDNNQNNQQTNNQQQNQDPNSVYNDFVKNLNLTNGVDLGTIQEDIQNGSTESLMAAFESVSANTFKASLEQMNKLADNKIQAAIDKAVSESTSTINESTAIREMNGALNFTTDKDIAPVANAALKQFINKGQSTQEAIESVKKFFEATANSVTGNSSQQNPMNGNFNPNSNINNSNNNSNSNASDDWMDVLTTKNR